MRPNRTGWCLPHSFSSCLPAHQAGRIAGRRPQRTMCRAPLYACRSRALVQYHRDRLTEGPNVAAILGMDSNLLQGQPSVGRVDEVQSSHVGRGQVEGDRQARSYAAQSLGQGHQPGMGQGRERPQNQHGRLRRWNDAISEARRQRRRQRSNDHEAPDDNPRQSQETSRADAMISSSPRQDTTLGGHLFPS